MGCTYIATGHYARRVETPKGPELRKGLDPGKDQSYVLACLTREQLERTLFPLGDLTKEQVRVIAEREGFVNARKRESQDICFVPDGDYLGFLERYTGRKSEPGPLVDENGKVLGTHRGAAGYTVGQRHGLGVAAARPLYVKSKDMEKNTVTVCFAEDLFSDTARVSDMNWIVKPEVFPFSCSARLRYRQKEAPCKVFQEENGDVLLRFDAPQRAVTSGQAAALYDGDRVLAGGTIV